MRYIIIGVVITMLFFVKSSAQNSNSDIYTVNVNHNKNIYVGVGIGFGIFNPGDVNDYINTQLEDYYIEDGFSEIIFNYNAKASLNFAITEYIYFTFFLEGAWAPKWIYSEDEQYFSFTKIAPGFAPKFYIPFGSGQHAFFVSPGVTYNKMSFESYSATNFGGKLQGGVSLNFGTLKLQPYGAINFVKASDGVRYQEFELNYTDFQMGVELLF